MNQRGHLDLISSLKEGQLLALELKIDHKDNLSDSLLCLYLLE